MDALAHVDLAALKIAAYPDPVLRQVCREVRRFDGSLRALAERMFQITYAARGVGLAAPQVGVAIRLFVANPDGQGPDGGVAYVNPSVLDQAGQVQQEEGCLSLPGVTCRMKRYARVTLTAKDLEGRPFQHAAEGLLARIFQHEMDHLNGILLVDRMTAAARLANRRALQELEEKRSR
jgi:peptide deformylase